MLTISLKDWTDTPGPGLRRHGTFSGEEWFETRLDPPLNTYPMLRGGLTIDLDGTYGVPMVFIREAMFRLGLKYGTWMNVWEIHIVSKEDPYLREQAIEFLLTGMEEHRKGKHR
jgi:hypothetical protein